MNIQAAGSSALYALSQPAPFRPRETTGGGVAPGVPPRDVATQADEAANQAFNPQAAAQANPLSRPPSPQEQAKQEADAQEAADTLQKVVSSLGHDLKFSVDKDSGEVVVKIVDPVSEEVIRQIPSEEALRIAKAIDTLRGVLIDHSA